MNRFDHNYFVGAAKEFNETIANYYSNTAHNYVIIEKDNVIVWNSNNCPIIFGSIDDALDELRCWSTPIENVSIKTERWLIDTYCNEEMYKAIVEEDERIANSDEKMLTFFMNPYNGHSKELVLKINRLWKKNKSKFCPILIALFHRDFDEIYNADSFGGLPTDKNDAWLSLSLNWETNAYNYLMHIADDGDLETIINFIR